MEKQRDEGIKKSGVTRRGFLKMSGTVTIGLGLGGLSNIFWTKEGQAAMAVSGGYLLVDVKKCQGCMTCMMACTMLHDGECSFTLSRLQVLKNSFEKFPDDITIEQCRQCVDAPCVENCPTGAMAPNPEYGNVRMVNQDECIGCGICHMTCPYTPSRPVLSEEAAYDGDKKSRKCDLCADTPFWDQEGGPNGKQGCVTVCPVGAISFTTEVPVQAGDSGYKVNLRDEGWANLGYSTD